MYDQISIYNYKYYLLKILYKLVWTMWRTLESTCLARFKFSITSNLFKIIVKISMGHVEDLGVVAQNVPEDYNASGYAAAGLTVSIHMLAQISGQYLIWIRIQQ